MFRWVVTAALVVAVVGCGAFKTRNDEATAKETLAKLQERLSDQRATRDSDREMTDLVGKLADLKHAPAKRAVYDTVFFWFGFDDVMTAHPELFEVKARLENEINKQVADASADLKNVSVTSLVFLDNRSELAADPKVAPKYRAIVHLRTSSLFEANGGDVRKRAEIANKLQIPAENIGMSLGVTANARVVSNVDERLETQPGYFLMWKVCTFLKHSHDENDARFLRWAVANKRLKRGLASELIPELFPPAERPEPAAEARDAEALSVKLFAHYGLAKLEKFDSTHPGSFQDQLDAGVLSKDDGVKIALYRFKEFTLRRNVVFSRRYEFSIHWVDEDGDSRAWAIGFNHLGKLEKADQETDTSDDIAADVQLMWSVNEKGASPQEAIDAASRVFNTVKLEGLPRAKVVELIGNSGLRPKGIYNFPFWPVGKDEVAYRFDTGFYGWQFNLKFDDKGTCESISRKWIH